MTFLRRSFLAVAILTLPLLGVRAGDSRSGAGRKRDALCTETGLLKEWPKTGPKVLWKIEGIGTGYSEVSIANGVIYTMGEPRDAASESR